MLNPQLDSRATGTSGGRRGRAARAIMCLALLCLTPIDARAIQQPEPPAEPALRETLERYVSALESLDADAVKKVQPSIDADGLKRAFGEMRSLDVEIDSIRVLSSDRTSARVSCRVTQTLTPKAGSRQKSTVTRVLRLRRQDTGWVIQDFER